MIGGKIRWTETALQCLDRNRSELRKRRRDPARPIKPLTGLTPHAKDLIERLLHHDPDMRIGCGPAGAQEIMNHPFFNNIDWAKLEKKHIVPPFIPNPDMVNAEFQQSEFDNGEPTRRERRKLKNLTDEDHAKAFDDINFVRPETFFEELAGCEVDFGGEEESAKHTTSKCVIM